MSEDIFLSQQPNKKEEANAVGDHFTDISLELQRYDAPITSSHSFDHENSQKFKDYKSKLNLRKNQIKKLRHKLKTAYVIAKTVLAAKENESNTFQKQLTFAKSVSAELDQKSKIDADTIESLTIENRVLYYKLENIYNFINMGYNELQIMREASSQNLPTEMQLKEIIICCGQYYADYCNEHEKCQQFEQKNRFLTSKMNILKTNLLAISEELKNLRYQNLRLQKENSFMKNKESSNEIRNNLSYSIICSQYKLEQQSLDPETSTKTDNDFNLCIERNFNFSHHLSLVQSLLNAQDVMLKDLKELSAEFSSTTDSDVTHSSVSLQK